MPIRRHDVLLTLNCKGRNNYIFVLEIKLNRLSSASGLSAHFITNTHKHVHIFKVKNCQVQTQKNLGQGSQQGKTNKRAGVPPASEMKMATSQQLIRWAQQRRGIWSSYITEGVQTGRNKGRWGEKIQRKREVVLSALSPARERLRPRGRGGSCTAWGKLYLHGELMTLIYEGRSTVARLPHWAKFSLHHICSAELGHRPAGGNLVIITTQPRE